MTKDEDTDPTAFPIVEQKSGNVDTASLHALRRIATSLLRPNGHQITGAATLPTILKLMCSSHATARDIQPSSSQCNSH